MKTFIILFMTVFLTASLYGQQRLQERDTTRVVDSLYREDQVYVGIAFNVLGSKPEGVSQNGFSGGVQIGILRDMPLNERRNKSIAIGLGWSYDTFNQNLFIGETPEDESIFTAIGNEIDVTTNRFRLQQIELPIELRWRTSNAEAYNFWRIYVGARLGYIYHFKSRFEQSNPFNEVIQTEVPELNRFQYGATLSFGYGAFNLQGYLGLSTLFNETATLSGKGQAVHLQVIRLGIQFYFL